MLFAIPKQLILYRLSVFARMKDYNFAHKLLAWYHENRRILPWRDTHDPYIIWISEIILQQTRVVQGYDYFLRFMNRFPDVDALAAASEDEVLKCWQGLGYGSRHSFFCIRVAACCGGWECISRTFPLLWD